MTLMHKKALGISLFVFLLDRVSKIWILDVYNLPSLGSVEVLPFFSLTMVWNYGISMGFFQADGDAGRIVITVLTAIITLVLLRWLFKESKTLVGYGLALVIGGAIGNIWDRVQFGAVADFLHFHISNISFYVFNVADSAITLGVVFLLWDALLSPQKTSK